MSLRRTLCLALLCVLSLLPLAARAAAVRSWERQLPAVARTQVAKQARDALLDRARKARFEKSQRPEDPEKRAQKANEERELLGMAKRVGQTVAASSDRRPILILVEGMDGVGKSSAIRRLKTAFAGVRRTRVVHRTKPSPDESTWLEWPMQQLGRRFDVLIMDRSYYGRLVYDAHEGMIGKKQLKQRIGQVRHFENAIDKSMRVIKFSLEADNAHLAKILAKRELESPAKLNESDYISYRDKDQVRARFDHAFKKTGDWHHISMNDRFEGRKKIFEILQRELADR